MINNIVRIWLVIFSPLLPCFPPHFNVRINRFRIDSAFATFFPLLADNLGRRRAQIFIRNRKDGGDKLARLARGSSGSPSLSSFMRRGKSSEPLKGGLRVSGEKSLGKPGGRAAWRDRFFQVARIDSPEAENLLKYCASGRSERYWKNMYFPERWMHKRFEDKCKRGCCEFKWFRGWVELVERMMERMVEDAGVYLTGKC